MPVRMLEVLPSCAETDKMSKPSAVGSARQAALGRQTGEGADPRDQLALGDRTTLLDLNLPLAAVSVVLGADLVGEVFGDRSMP